MKRIFIIIISAILLSVSSNGQWYNRRYGVSDLNQLSQEQLNLALVNANFEFASGIFLAVVGITGLYSGISHAKSAPPGDIGGALGGLIMSAISVPIEIAGWIILTINLTRIERIKEVKKSTEMHIGLINCQNENLFSGSQVSFLPCLSLTIHF